MRDTLYQDSGGRAPGRAGHPGLLAAAALLWMACDRPAAPQPPAPAPAASTEVAGPTVHFTKLRSFLPDKVLDFEGARPTASTSRFNSVAVSEAERSYHQGERKASVRIVDTNLHTGGAPPRASWEDERTLHRSLDSGDAQGFFELDKQSRLAQADLVVAGRFVVTVKLEDARGPEEMERLVAALALDRLAALAPRDAGSP